MGVVVEMFRDAVDPQGRHRFSCALSTWQFLRELGETFGWRPHGTTYSVPPNVKVEVPALRNYQPGDALDHKRVTAEDAMSWAAALNIAKRSAHLDAMIKARLSATGASCEMTEGLLLSLLDEFIQYAYGGAFTFAISADDSVGRQGGQ